MPPTIRTAALTDAPALAGLLRSVGYWERFNTAEPEAAASHVARHLAACLADDSHTLLVAESEAGAIVGYANTHWLPYLFLPAPEGYVSELFVRPEARGQGIGALLLEAVLAEARRRGCSRLSLLNSKQRDSYQRGFYSQNGWEERSDMANFIFRI